ncbi:MULTISPECIES: DUF6969 family protein [Nitrospirillum]|uniref:DUF6969 domain-containing protein n=1 Tax=Nitrospirillum amazonense TaxID=28077 RepID=A0A560G511_9PROT|nr:hypothetical protein [Nitrospirillum amazonense]MEC4591370.1 hypothetical protein [Nitrospirillum amazonense]TWB28969.1 hypothetical protein FBZ88_104134 [Nitrospirillum amazonense]
MPFLRGPARGSSVVDGLPYETLTRLVEAAREVSLCTRVLAKTGDTVLSEVLRDAVPPLDPWHHHPPGDVYDSEYHAQYYFHAHPESELVGEEMGHFHTFMRPLGMPEGVAPAPLPDLQPDADGNAALSHLVGISVDGMGRVTRLFTTNRWVTGETWYAAADVVRMLEGFQIDHARPSWPLNRWITAVVNLYRYEIIELLQERDAAVGRWQADHPGSYVYDDRNLEVTSERLVDVDGRIQELERALRRRNRQQSPMGEPA